MKLGQKNLFYSMVLAGGMLIFLVGYFVYMLPSLYVDHTMEQNLKAVKEQHRAFREQGSYDNVQLKNPTACFSLKIPDKGNSINFTTKMFSADITIKDESGAIAKIANILADKNISIKNIGIVNNRETIDGALNIVFSSFEEQEKGYIILTQNNYIVSKIN